MKWDIFNYMWIGMWILALLFLWGCLILSFTKQTKDMVWQKKAAQTECAQYHPKTGKFEWIDRNE
jgi:preprotein translocase subunit SecG